MIGNVSDSPRIAASVEAAIYVGDEAVPNRWVGGRSERGPDGGIPGANRLGETMCFARSGTDEYRAFK